MVLFASSCTSQGKSHSHDVWYFPSLLLFPAKTSGWDSAFLLSPSSFVKFNCCVAWMSSLFVTSGQNQNELNSCWLISSPYLFVWLVHRKSCEEWAQTYPWILAREEKHVTVIFLQLLDFILVPAARVLSLTTCPNGQLVQLAHLPNT